VPTISFSVAGGSPEAIVRAVDTHGIGIRHGHFYSKGILRALGIEPSEGVIRVSMVHYNTPAELERLIGALDAAIGRPPRA
jgi:selenocysteine lyase/cysteine desulfurase